MSVLYNAPSEDVVTSKQKVDVVIISDDEDMEGKGHDAVVEEEVQVVSHNDLKGKQKSTAQQNMVPAKMMDAYYQSPEMLSNSFKRRCSKFRSGRPTKRPLRLHETPGCIVVDSSDESPRRP